MSETTSNSRFSLAARSRGVFALVGLLFVVCTVVAYYGFFEINRRYNKLSATEVKAREEVRDIINDMLMLRRHEKDYIMRGTAEELTKHKERAQKASQSIKDLEQLLADAQMKELATAFERELKSYEAEFLAFTQADQLIGGPESGYWHQAKNIGEDIEKGLGPSESQSIASLHKMRTAAIYYLLKPNEKTLGALKQNFEASQTTYSAIKEESMRLTALKKLSDYIAVFDQVIIQNKEKASAEDRMRAAIHRFEKTAQKLLETATLNESKQKETIDQIAKSLERTILIASATGLVFLVFFSFYLGRVIARIVSLGGELKLSAGASHAAGESVSDTSARVSTSVTQQAAAVQETVSTLNELTAMVNKSVESAKISAEKAQSGHQIALTSKENVGAMITAMEEINSSNQQVVTNLSASNREIAQIINVINEISLKTNVINDIVFQTKLLSFNASVEAARAGEHGKGFAVVAEEVGNLAQMSGAAAKEINDLLNSSIAQVEGIISKGQSSVESLIASSGEKIAHGVDLAKRCGDSLSEVVVNVEEVKKMMSEISLASQEQAEGINNITTAMNELDDATHSNSAVAAETDKLATTLKMESDHLREIVQKLDCELLGSKKVFSPLKEAMPAAKNKNLPPKIASNSRPAKVASDKVIALTPKVTPKKTDIPSEEDSRFKEVI